MAKPKPPKAPRGQMYDPIIQRIFENNYKEPGEIVPFERSEIESVADDLGIKVPANLGDVLYAYRFRKELPKVLRERLRDGEEWVIRLTGAARYEFARVPRTNIAPQSNLYRIKVPDATPEIVSRWSLSDEQAVLAKVRYNRLLDLFLGLTTYSLQNHLRTQVDGKQIEIDELYVGIHASGAQFAIPVQAKGGKDKIGRVQLEQDLEYCQREMQNLGCRPIAVQALHDGGIAIFELGISSNKVQIVQERHYDLVDASEIGPKDLIAMRQNGGFAPLDT